MLLPAAPVREARPSWTTSADSKTHVILGRFVGRRTSVFSLQTCVCAAFVLSGLRSGAAGLGLTAPLANMIEMDFASTCAHICLYHLDFLCTHITCFFFFHPTFVRRHLFLLQTCSQGKRVVLFFPPFSYWKFYLRA